MDRRTFLKSSVAAVGGLAIGRMAYAWPPIPTSVLGGSITTPATSFPWGSWDGLSESTLKVDQNNDSTEDTNVVFMENTVAAGNETSRGVGTGIQLVYTENGAMVGATDTPPYRLLDGTSWFSFSASGLANPIFTTAAQKWSAFVKCRLDAVSDKIIMEIYGSGGGAHRITVLYDSSAKLSLFLQEAGGGYDIVATSDSVPTNTDIIIGAWGDNSSFARAGWTTTVTKMPTKLSDFAAAKTCVCTTYKGSFSGTTFNYASLWGNYDGSQAMKGRGYWSVISSTCFIDNAA